MHLVFALVQYFCSLIDIGNKLILPCRSALRDHNWIADTGCLQRQGLISALRIGRLHWFGGSSEDRGKQRQEHGHKGSKEVDTAAKHNVASFANSLAGTPSYGHTLMFQQTYLLNAVTGLHFCLLNIINLKLQGFNVEYLYEFGDHILFKPQHLTKWL